ncbi:MAG: hypothetical protein QOE41_4104, partial [Mycobacterium sp.]|nr:hypothetical protein [Mycobacterium sp.]
ARLSDVRNRAQKEADNLAAKEERLTPGLLTWGGFGGRCNYCELLIRRVSEPIPDPTAI